eukprot:8735191-Alexandrium_andersonii.AAC.1
MEGGLPGKVEKKSRFREKGDHCPESNLHVLEESAQPTPSMAPRASSMTRLCPSCMDPAFSRTT